MPIESNARGTQAAKENCRSGGLGWLFLRALQSYREKRIRPGLEILSAGHGQRTREVLWWSYPLTIAAQQRLLEFSGLSVRF